MMTIWCYSPDEGMWGQMLYDECVSRNWGAKLFTDFPPAMSWDYAFMRIPQWEPGCGKGKRVAQHMQDRKCILIPDLASCKVYEDKMAQFQLYGDWMPETHIILHPCSRTQLLDDSIEKLGLPFISKGNVASASANVRLIRTRADAIEEYEKVFCKDGIPMRAGGRTLRQKGYLIWQKFLAGNDCDYRVCINGEYLNILKRGIRSAKEPFASGSGKTEPITKLGRDMTSLLAFSERFFHQHKLTWGGIDVVWDRELEHWSVLETTLGWSFDAYKECVYFHGLEPTEYTGKDMFKVICEGIINRSFLK